MKIQKKIVGGGGSGRGIGSGWGGWDREQKVLYNVQKDIVQYVLRKLKKKKKNMWGGGAIFEPKTLSRYLKQKKEVKKILTEPGLKPTTLGLEKPALLSTRLNTITAITKYE